MRNRYPQRVTDMPEKLARGMCLLFLGAGVIMLVVAVLLGVRTAKRTSSWVAVDAEITGLSDGRHGLSYTAVKYEANGKTYTTVLHSYSSSYKVGKKIPISYDPKDPFEVTEGGVMGYLATIILGFLGLGFTAGPAFLLIRTGNFPKLRRSEPRPGKQKDKPAPWEY